MRGIAGFLAACAAIFGVGLLLALLLNGGWWAVAAVGMIVPAALMYQRR